jgi:hypothetical protein
MADTFERRRNEVVEFVKSKLAGASDSRAAAMARRYCATFSIPANSLQIADIANEALRRQMVEKMKDQQAEIDTLQGQVVTLLNMITALNDKVNGFHP